MASGSSSTSMHPESAAAMGNSWFTMPKSSRYTVIYEFPNLTVLWEQRHWTSFKINGTGGGAEIGGSGTLVIDRTGWVLIPGRVNRKTSHQPDASRASEFRRVHSRAGQTGGTGDQELTSRRL